MVARVYCTENWTAELVTMILKLGVIQNYAMSK